MSSNCPDCGSPLGKEAYKCRCGWKGSSIAEGRPRAPCAIYGCGALTIAREKTPTGWANFCEAHYIEYHHQRSALRVREELKLETVEEMKGYCRQKVKTIFRSVRSGKNTVVANREPGQDDEEREAA